MSIAWRELRRRPGRFSLATGVLALLVTLLVFLGGLLDGLFLGSTGAIRAQTADVIVYSAAAQDSFVRSRIDPALRARVSDAAGVEDTGGIGLALVGAAVPGRDEPADVAAFGYELPPRGVPPTPAPGGAWADGRLRASGVGEGDTLLLGRGRVPVRVLGFVSDTSYLLQGSLWMAPATWRAVQRTSRPDAAVAPGVFQALAVTGRGSPADLARSIDRATGGRTSSLTRDEAIYALPGTAQQNRTLNGIIWATLTVVALVVALFFVLLTLERAGLFAVLKAMGASSVQLLAGVVLQAIVVAVAALIIGICVGVGLATLAPDEIPLRLEASRIALTCGLVVLASIAGSVVSLRRVAGADPATAIGRSA